jgi:cytochrome c553
MSILQPLLRVLAILALLPFASGEARADSIEEKAELCTGCHGEQGVPQEKTTPIIWGQTEGYIYIELRDYKNGTRKHEIMSQIAATLERQDMFDLAAYFAAKPWPDTQQPKAAAAAASQAVTANTSVGCTGCHLDRYQGTGTAPRIADQNLEYLAKTMTDFRTGDRGNNPGMTSLMKSISDSDIAALAAYLAAL